MTIQETQEKIIQEFEILREGYGDDMYKAEAPNHLMELGKSLPGLPPQDKVPENEVKGCMSTVWMVAREEGGNIFFDVDSNTLITKGLLGLLVRVFSGRTPDEILNTEPYFMNAIGMERFLVARRTSGFVAMLTQMKRYALGYKTRAEVRS